MGGKKKYINIFSSFTEPFSLFWDSASMFHKSVCNLADSCFMSDTTAVLAPLLVCCRLNSMQERGILWHSSKLGSTVWISFAMENRRS